ncbi:hypothetical protein DRN72_03110, partial [Methanosarcinales archaeon]
MIGMKTIAFLFIVLCICGCVEEKPLLEEKHQVNQTNQLNQTNQTSSGQKSELIEQVEEHKREVPTARIAATLNFGDVVLFDKEIEIENGKTSAMEALRRVASIQTAYGGGFVEAINGHASLFKMGKKVDWFYTINGFIADVGATQYILHPGDFEIWDYHKWESYGKVAIIGAYPEPFVHGYNGVVRNTIIVYQDGLREEAEKLKDSLEDAGARVELKRWE